MNLSTEEGRIQSAGRGGNRRIREGFKGREICNLGLEGGKRSVSARCEWLEKQLL